MNAYRLNTIIVGVAFIVATGAGIAAAAIGSPILGAPDYLSQIAANEDTILTGAFLIYLMSIACAVVGLGLYPILRKYKRARHARRHPRLWDNPGCV